MQDDTYLEKIRLEVLEQFPGRRCSLRDLKRICDPDNFPLPQSKRTAATKRAELNAEQGSHASLAAEEAERQEAATEKRVSVMIQASEAALKEVGLATQPTQTRAPTPYTLPYPHPLHLPLHLP
mmetsp:Transcript_28042/g.63513  ORF Transcript_28042/g.63513 Transcript_28042/m.63513 type:complete len:124 (+) Transcript_28042:215-586(+)